MASHRRGIVASLIATIVTAALLAPPASASHVEDCPDFIATDDLERGMTGTGHTVAEGNDMEEFDVEILGVLEHALGPGRDMIVVEASGGIVQEHGGIWGGMSGSPVYIDDELVGAVAFGLSWGPSAIAGLTPAEEMFKVLAYPDSHETAAAPRRVPISPRMRHRIAMSSGMQTDQVASSLRQLSIPVSISGVSRRGMTLIEEVMDRENLGLIPYSGSAASSSAVQPSDEEIRPGDNLASALAYGDVTFAGVGTATFVCDGRVMGFGHPMLWEGDTTLGANHATSLAVIEDVFGSYEIATIDERIGLMDQDRFAGVRTLLGQHPAVIPIESSIHAENTDRSRDGRTDALVSEILPFLTYFHLSGNLLMTMDEYSEGSADLSWTIEGTDADGDEWSFSRSNLYSSEWGIADEATFEISGVLNTLYFNQFEDIEFTGVEIEGSADDEIEQYTLTEVEVSTDGVEYSDKQRVRARPGDTIYVRMELKSYSGETRSTELTVTVPEGARSSGFLEILGGGMSDIEAEICLYDPAACADQAGKKIESFDDLLANLASRPKNNELVAKLRMGRRNRVKSEATALLDQVVRGEAYIFVRLPGGRGGGGPVVGPEEGEGGY